VGIAAGENGVQRLCSEHRIWSVFAKKRGCGRKPGPPVHDDLVLRDFTAGDLDLLWFTDLTEHPTGEGKLYLCALKDACSTRIVGYSMGPRMTARLATSALRNAIALRDPKGTVVVHSDRGSQFGSRDWIRTLRDAGLQGSMGRVGACGDNATMESFFSLLQKNVLDRQRWQTRDELRLAITIWIERTYHRRRRQRGLGRLTPIEFEILAAPAQAA
jgi:transposase InsO family protein